MTTNNQRTAGLDLEFPYDAGAALEITVTGYDLTQPGVEITLRIHRVRGGKLLVSYTNADPEITIDDATTLTISIAQAGDYADLAAGTYAYGMDFGIDAIAWRVQGDWEILRAEGMVSPGAVAASVAVDQITVAVTVADKCQY